jgi:DNA-binding LytR/AlgR family response regulator
MGKIKILIVEDELIIAEDMKVMLFESGYDVTGIAKNCKQAEDILRSQLPDIALIDIRLYCGDDGIQLAKTVKEDYDIPIIFVTSNADKSTVQRAKEVQPSGYVVKPFEKEDLYAAIEISISNFTRSQSEKMNKESNSYLHKEFLFIKKNYQFEKVKINDIKWIKSEGNYLELFCLDKTKYLIRSTFKELFQNIAFKSFTQVHKSYAVNFEYVDTLRYNELIIGKDIIPIGKMYREIVKKHLNIVS